MIKYFNIVLLLTLFLSSCNKDKAVPDEPIEENTELTNSLVSGTDCIRFLRHFSGAKIQYCSSVKLSSDGGYLFSGQFTINYTKKNFIFKTDCHGETVSIIEVNTMLNISIADLTESSSGGYTLLCVDDQSYVNTTKLKNYLMKINQNGDLLWSAYLGTGDRAFPRRIKELPNGDYVLAGFDVNQGAFIYKVNPFGITQWSSIVSQSKFFDFKTKPNGNIVLCGTKDDDIFVTELNSGGTTIWSTTFDKMSVDNTATDIELLNNEIFISGYNFSSSGGGVLSNFVLKMDASGNELWYTTDKYGILTKTHDDKILCTFSNSNELILNKIEPSSGSTIFTKSKSMFSSSALGVKLTPDNGFVVFGKPGPFFLLKTDEFGE